MPRVTAYDRYRASSAVRDGRGSEPAAHRALIPEVARTLVIAGRSSRYRGLRRFVAHDLLECP